MFRRRGFVIDPALQPSGPAMTLAEDRHHSFEELIEGMVKEIAPIGGIFEGTAGLHLGTKPARHDQLRLPAQGLVEPQQE
jgi:hypothetical protein